MGRGLVAAVLLLAVLSSCASGDRGRLPTVVGETRPAFISFTGDGSQIMGGVDGTGAGPQQAGFGHIRWTEWSTTDAIGFAAAWDRCFDAYGCATPYTRDGKRVTKITALQPVVEGEFTHFLLDRSCWVYVFRPARGFYPANCRTWRPL